MSHARAAGCPLVVAITKCDAPNAEPQRVRQQLLAEGLELEEAGGTVRDANTGAILRYGKPGFENPPFIASAT